MLQFDLQFYEELTVAWVRTVKFISEAFFWPTGQLVCTPKLNRENSLILNVSQSVSGDTEWTTTLLINIKQVLPLMQTLFK